jgi:hypothetical protein
MPKNFYVVISCLVLLLLVGCCPPQGPMKQPNGPVDTALFEPIFFNFTKDDSSTVLFKEHTTVYEDDKFKQWGLFVITDTSNYLVNWDTIGYEYKFIYKIKHDEIESLGEKTIIRKWLPDSDLLIIKGKNGIETGFALNGRRAARSIIEKNIQNITMANHKIKTDEK